MSGLHLIKGKSKIEKYFGKWCHFRVVQLKEHFRFLSDLCIADILNSEVVLDGRKYIFVVKKGAQTFEMAHQKGVVITFDL